MRSAVAHQSLVRGSVAERHTRDGESPYQRWRRILQRGVCLWLSVWRLVSEVRRPLGSAKTGVDDVANRGEMALESGIPIGTGNV